MAVDLSPPPEKKASNEYQLLWVLAGACIGNRLFFKLDTSVHFTDSSFSPNYIGRTKATRPPGFSPPSSPFAVGRSKRHNHLRVCSSSKAKTKLKKRPSRPVLPPLLPEPDFKSISRKNLPPLPDYTAVAALGSKIFVIGGTMMLTPLHHARDLPRDVLVYDTRIPGSPPQISSQLNCGKGLPFACTVNGKIYIMPKTFYFPPSVSDGLYFECFDPLSNSWSILPDPPFVGRGMGYVHSLMFMDCFRVMSHVVVGSNLMICIRAGGIYRFDTAQPDRGWKKISLSLQHATPLVLDYLPFPHRTSLTCSLRQGHLLSQVICNGSGDKVYELLLNTLNFEEKALYVCSFDDLDALSDPETELVPITIKPVIGMKHLRWEKFTKYGDPSLSRIEDGVVIHANYGFEDRKCKVGLYYGFDMLRIERVLNQGGEFHYEASSISWALFRAKDPLGDECEPDTLSVLVINKDGNFSS